MLLVVGSGLTPRVGFRMEVCSWVNHVPGETERLVVMVVTPLDVDLLESTESSLNT